MTLRGIVRRKGLATSPILNLSLITMAAKPDILKFAPFNSSVDVGFWFELAKKKLDELKLDERELPVTGFFGLASSAEPPARFSLEASSFSKDFEYVIMPSDALGVTNEA